MTEEEKLAMPFSRDNERLRRLLETGDTAVYAKQLEDEITARWIASNKRETGVGNR